jgi:adenylate kinase
VAAVTSRRSSSPGRAVERQVAEGILVGEEVVFRLLAERVIETPDVGGYVLDGFPRTQSQAEMLDSFRRPRQLASSIVIVLDAPDGILLARLLARRVPTGREDDRESVARRRLDLYRATVAPLLQFYDRRPPPRRCDGERGDGDRGGAGPQLPATRTQPPFRRSPAATPARR